MELSIKSMKSLLNLQKLRAHRGSARAAVYLYGQVLSLLLVEQGLRTPCGHAWGDVERERVGTAWRLYKLLQARLDAILMAQWAGRPAAVPACVHVLRERPRKRLLQRLPQPVVALRSLLDALPKAGSFLGSAVCRADRLAPMGRSPHRHQAKPLGSLAPSPSA